MQQNFFMAYEANRLRYKEMMRQAHREYCVQTILRQIRSYDQPRPSIYRPALARMGRLLVRWGESLEQRYGRMTPLCVEQAETQPSGL